MKNKLAFILGFTFSVWFSFAALNFATQILPQSHVTIALAIPELPKVPYVAHQFTQQDYDCLHENIFFEARNQPPFGMAMVGIVTIKRSQSPEFAHTICGVVHESHQFSWTLKKHKVNHKDKIEEAAWVFTGLIAQNLLIGYDSLDNQYHGVVYYHSTKVHPSWARHLKKEFVIGDHVFYSKDGNEEAPSFVLR